MPRKTRVALANSAIAVAALAGAIGLTNHFTPSATAATTATSSTAAATTSNNVTAATVAKATTVKAAGKTGSATSVVVPYRFGQVQVSVTKTKGKITAISYGSSSATNGREAAFPYLVKYAISAQGTNFSNLSGATFTTDAFKQALSSALTKLG